METEKRGILLRIDGYLVYQKLHIPEALLKWMRNNPYYRCSKSLKLKQKRLRNIDLDLDNDKLFGDPEDWHSKFIF